MQYLSIEPSPILGITASSALIITKPLSPYSPHLFQLLFQPSVFFKLIGFLLSDVAVARDFYICHHCLLLLFVDQQDINTMSGWLAFTSLSVSIWRSHRTLAHSFSITLGGVFHSDLGTSSPFSVQMLLYTTSATWLFLLPSYTLTLCVGLHTHTHIQCKVGCLFWK